MKRMSQLFLLLVLVLVPMLFCHAYDGPGQLVTLMTVYQATEFNDAYRAVDGELRCVNGNAYVNAGKEGEVWFNLGTDYYVEGMEILVRYEGGETKEVGIYAECYETMESAAPTSKWFNNNQTAGPSESGYWHRIYQNEGTLNAKTHFVKVRLDNLGYPSPMAVGEFRVYARPTPGVELPSSSYRFLSQTNITAVYSMLDGSTDHHAYIEPYLNGGAWIELDQEYPIAAVQVDLHSEEINGKASLSFFAYGTPSGGTHEGYYERTAPPGAVIGFEKNSGRPIVDWIPYSAQFPEDNACGHHRTHWYTMQHTYGHLGQKAKYIYIYLDNSNNDSVMCIDDIRVFRSYDLTEDCVTLSQTTFPNNGENHRPTVSVTGPHKTIVGGVISYTPHVTLTDVPHAQHYSPAEYSDYVVHYPKESKEGGTYTLTVVGHGIYTGTITKEYHIKLPSKIVLDREMLFMHNVKTDVYKTATANIISQIGDGALSVSSSDASVATATIDGTTITVTDQVSDEDSGYHSADIIITKAETELYMGTSVTLPVANRQHYMPVGRYIDRSQMTLTSGVRWFSREEGKDTMAEILDMMLDGNRQNYGVTKDDDQTYKESSFQIVFNEDKSLCDAVVRYATSFPGDLTVKLQFRDEADNLLIEEARTKSYCDKFHRTMRVFPANKSVVDKVRKVTVIVNYSELSGSKEAHIYEVGLYEPVEVDHVFADPEEKRMVNTVSAEVPQQTVDFYIGINGWNVNKMHSIGSSNWHDPDMYYPDRFYAPIPIVHNISMTEGQYGTISQDAYTRDPEYQDALGVIEDKMKYTAMSDTILFMRGNTTFVTGQDAVYGDNATFVNDTVVEENTGIVSYTGDWQTGDGDERFEHAKVIHVTKDATGAAQLKVFLKASQRLEVTTDIGPYQGRVNVTLAKGDTVYCSDFIDGFFPVNAQNVDKYKVSNMTGTAMDELNNRRQDYWNESQINVFTAPETGLYTVTLDVPWNSYLVSGLGGRYTYDEPACKPCTVIDSIRVLPANEEWNFSFSDTQKFVFQDADVNKCTTEIENGCLKITALGNDHFAYTIDHLNFDASSYKGIEVIVSYDIKNLYYTQTDGVEHQDKAQIFFTRTDSGSMNQAMSVAVPLETASTDGKFIVLEFPMAQNAEWTGTIRRLRFDLNNGPEGTHHVRAIRLVRYDE